MIADLEDSHKRLLNDLSAFGLLHRRKSEPSWSVRVVHMFDLKFGWLGVCAWVYARGRRAHHLLYDGHALHSLVPRFYPTSLAVSLTLVALSKSIVTPEVANRSAVALREPGDSGATGPESTDHLAVIVEKNFKVRCCCVKCLVCACLCMYDSMALSLTAVLTHAHTNKMHANTFTHILAFRARCMFTLHPSLPLRWWACL